MSAIRGVSQTPFGSELPFRWSSDAEKNRYSAIESHHVLICKTANLISQFGLWNAHDFVHHKSAIGTQAIRGIGNDREAKQWR